MTKRMYNVIVSPVTVLIRVPVCGLFWGLGWTFSKIGDLFSKALPGFKN